jgi:integrase/recombinase XerD
LADVDLGERVLTVRGTKFYKSRLVPIGHQLAGALSRYIEQRGTLPMPQGAQSAMLASRAGQRQSYQRVITLFQRVRARADIGVPLGESRPPRLHDLRHTAAVHRLVAWYQQGHDVQQLLPRLATYLGHVDIDSTRRYLQMTPELLQQASSRFAAYANLDVREADHA